VTTLVNIGCGARWHDAWSNFDLVPLDPSIKKFDLRRGLPFGDGEVDAVYHSHVLEHLSRRDAVALVNECARVLAPGGVLRVGVPDLEELARQYLSALEAARRGDPGGAGWQEWAVAEMIDQLARQQPGGRCAELLTSDDEAVIRHSRERWGTEADELRAAALERRRTTAATPPSFTRRARSFARARLARFGEHGRVGRYRLGGEPHLWMYDEVSLTRLLVDSGFTAVTNVTWDQSRIPAWSSFGLEGTADSPFKFDTLTLEATR